MSKIHKLLEVKHFNGLRVEVLKMGPFEFDAGLTLLKKVLQNFLTTSLCISLNKSFTRSFKPIWVSCFNLQTCDVIWHQNIKVHKSQIGMLRPRSWKGLWIRGFWSPSGWWSGVQKDASGSNLLPETSYWYITLNLTCYRQRDYIKPETPKGKICTLFRPR